MDLIDSPPKFDVSDRKWNIYSRNMPLAPHYIGKNAKIINSTLTEGCVINGEINHCVISAGVSIAKGARVIDSVIMSGARIGKNVIIKKAVIGEGTVIADGAQIGTVKIKENPFASHLCSNNLILIESGTEIPKNTVIPAGSMVEAELLKKGE